MRQILVVDDEPNIHWLFRELLKDDEVMSAGSCKEATSVLESKEPDLIMLDIRLPGQSGIEFLDTLKKERPEIPVIIMTAYGDVKTAVRAMKAGAHDYVTKPFDKEELRLIIEGALRYRTLSQEVSRLKRELEEKFHVKNIITVSPKMLDLFPIIERVSSADVSVLIQGESGTGKELVAKAIHYASPRRDRPFVAVNCAALPESLLESELFGYEEGAFTGARKRKPGRLELAQGGTVLLDEVGDLPLAVQPKILRALEEKTIDRLGGTKSVPVDVRIIAATHRDLWQEVQEGKFRNDLYFRLAVIPLHIPALRERPEDIPVLARHFLREAAISSGRMTAPPPTPSSLRRTAGKILRISDPAMDLLVGYSWPGNVRELRNVMQQVTLMADDRTGTIDPDLLPPNIRTDLRNQVGFGSWTSSPASVPTTAPPSAQSRLGITDSQVGDLKAEKDQIASEFEKERILDTLARFGGNRTKAAAALGISRRTLHSKIKKMGLAEKE